MKEIILSIAVLFSGSFSHLEKNKSPEKAEIHRFQESGLVFQKISFADAKAEAMKTGKLVFIDAYTSWCGPCKLLERNTFSNPEVASFFNKNFVNMRVEMEQDKDAAEIYRTYTVTAYPTLLFIDAKGKLIKRVLGYRDAKALLEEVKDLVKQ